MDKIKEIRRLVMQIVTTSGRKDRTNLTKLDMEDDLNAISRAGCEVLGLMQEDI